MLNKKTFLYIGGVVILIVISIFVFNNKNDYKTHTVEKKRFVDTAEISGKIKPAQELNLAFEVVGKISKTNVDIGDVVKTGDVLAEIDGSEISSELSEVLANLEKEKSILAGVSGDTTNQNELQNAGTYLLQTIKKTYITSDDIIKNIVDKFFDDPNLRFPKFTTALSNYFLRQEINDQRHEIGNLLEDWKEQVDILDPSIVDNSDADNAIYNLKEIEKLLAKISSEVDDYNPTGDVTQAQIDAYITNISNSRNNIANLIVEVNSVYDQFRNVLAELPVLQASVDNARASVNKLYARQSKYILRAPFDGIITSQDVEVGQIISANENIISMISEESFEIEGFVPELNIIGVDVGDKAILKLDAFGSDVEFESEISHVDPRETIKDGITTYRILLSLLDKKDDIRSGMTVDIKIEKDSVDNQIIIPRYLVEKDDQGDYVKILENGKSVRRDVVLGETDSGGGIIVKQGLLEGDKIIIQK